jgi:hypothetical protein
LRLTHVEGAVLGAGLDPAAAARIRDALAACVERVELYAAPLGSESLCEALEGCKAHALLAASAELGELEPRAALALIAGMPARGGPGLIAFARSGTPDLRLVVLRADTAARLRQGLDIESLDSLLVPAEWL